MKKNPWPYAIILYFVVFITAMTAWIVFAVRNDHQLVRSDYYEQELKYQADLDGQSRAAKANIAISYDSTKQTVTLALPREVTECNLYFYRPADAGLDRNVPLTLKDGVQNVNVAQFESGHWKVRLTWKCGGLEYRHNATLNLAPTKLTSL